jgi:hypothetical protein
LRLPLAQIAEGHRRIETGRTIGKVARRSFSSPAMG